MSAAVTLFKNLLKILEVRPSIVTQAQFDELAEMKLQWEEKKKKEERDNLEILFDVKDEPKKNIDNQKSFISQLSMIKMAT